jgi:hypothetical protein
LNDIFGNQPVAAKQDDGFGDFGNGGVAQN